jgi:Yip1 domain
LEHCQETSRPNRSYKQRRTFVSMRRIAGVLRHPRSTMAALVAAPSWLPTWALILAVWLVPAGWLLSTETGRQALVDERVRQIEAFGGRVDDAEYETLRRSPPLGTYFASGGRVLLAPPVTVLVAVGLGLLARIDGAALSLGPALAVSVHASVVLALQQLVATPLHYLRESLTSPTNLAVFLPGLEDGTVGARLFGAVDIFGLWWLWLLALGVAAATGRPARRYLARLLVVYVAVAAGVAVAMALSGGS